MKKILIVSSTFPASDSDPVPAFVKEQANWFKKLHPDLDISILAPHNSYSRTRNLTRHEFYDEYRFHYFWPFKLEKLAGRGIAPALKANPLLYFQIPFLFIFEIIALWRLARKLKPDLIYAHWFTPQAIAAAAISKITKMPFVFTTHSSDIAILKKIPLSKKLIAVICNKALGYTSVSHQTTDKLLAAVPDNDLERIKKKLKIIPMGSFPMQPPDTKVLDNIVERHNLTDKKVILFIGRLASIKGIDYLIEAFAAVSAEEPSARLVIAGEGHELNRLKDLAGKLKISDRVIFVGHVSGGDKAAFFSLADIICIPSVKHGSHSEGLPVVFMEALMAGKIVAASDVSGTLQYIEDGVNGFIFPEKDSQALSQTLVKITKLNGTDIQKLKKQAVKTADNFRWDKVAESHYRFFNELLR